MLTFTFTPSERRGYAISLPLKVAQNPGMRSVLLRGAGESPDLSFAIAPPLVPPPPTAPLPDPAVVGCGPQLPRTDAPSHRIVTVTNRSAVPLEVMSLDFERLTTEQRRELDKIHTQK